MGRPASGVLSMLSGAPLSGLAAARDQYGPPWGLVDAHDSWVQLEALGWQVVQANGPSHAASRQPGQVWRLAEPCFSDRAEASRVKQAVVLPPVAVPGGPAVLPRGPSAWWWWAWAAWWFALAGAWIVHPGLAEFLRLPSSKASALGDQNHLVVCQLLADRQPSGGSGLVAMAADLARCGPCRCQGGNLCLVTAAGPSPGTIADIAAQSSGCFLCWAFSPAIGLRLRDLSDGCWPPDWQSSAGRPSSGHGTHPAWLPAGGRH